MTIPILLQFRKALDAPNTPGLKHVLFKLTEGERLIGFDWGYANFDGNDFEQLGGADAPTAKVVMWSEMPNPQLLLG